MKNHDCNGCFYKQVDHREYPCNGCFMNSRFVHRDVFKDVDDSPVWKQKDTLTWVKSPADGLRETFCKQEYDTVNKPKHYMLFESEDVDAYSCKDIGIEARDVIEKLVLKLKQADNCVPLWEKGAMFEADYVQMMQYLMRFMDKNGKEDLRKAEFYLKKMIDAYE